VTIRVAEDSRDDALAAVAARADAGSGAATLKIYTGTQPATANTSPSGTLLATFTMADPCFESPASGVMDFDAAPDLTATAVANGTVGWARLADSDGIAVLDGSVGGVGSDFVVSSLTIGVGLTVTFVSGAVTFPV
jgi:hypothetical protein